MPVHLAYTFAVLPEMVGCFYQYQNSLKNERKKKSFENCYC